MWMMFTYVHRISTSNLLVDLFVQLYKLTVSFGIKNAFYILIHRCIYTLPSIHLVCNENEKDVKINSYYFVQHLEPGLGFWQYLTPT